MIENKYLANRYELSGQCKNSVNNGVCKYPCKDSRHICCLVCPFVAFCAYRCYFSCNDLFDFEFERAWYTSNMEFADNFTRGILKICSNENTDDWGDTLNE